MTNTLQDALQELRARQERIVFTQAAPPASLPGAHVDLGVRRWTGGGTSYLTFVAKLSLTYAGKADGAQLPTARFAPQPRGLSLAEDSFQPEALGSEMYYPGDFAPRKAAADILLVGHARTAEPATKIHCALAVDGWRRDRRGARGTTTHRRRRAGTPEGRARGGETAGRRRGAE